MEWAMTELLRSPEKMVKAQSEIRQVIGENGVVQESDIPRLLYLQAIVKETLRLHPPAALIPRKSESDVQILGFLIPENTQVCFMLIFITPTFIYLLVTLGCTFIALWFGYTSFLFVLV